MNREAIESFVDEIRDELPRLRRAFAIMHACPEDGDALAEAHRLAHAIKGTAALIEMDVLREVAGKLEGLLEALQVARLSMDGTLRDTLERLADLLETCADHLQSGTGLPDRLRDRATALVRRHWHLDDDSRPALGADPQYAPQDSHGRFDSSAAGDDPHDRFRNEALLHLSVMMEMLDAYRRDLTRWDLLADVRRRIHALQRSGEAIGFLDFAQLAGHAEKLLQQVLDRTLPPTDSVADCLQACADALEERVDRTLDESLLEQLHNRIDELCDSSAQGISLSSHSFAESDCAASRPANVHESSDSAKPEEINREDHDTETFPTASFEPHTEVSLAEQPEISEEMREVFTEEADDHLRLIYSAFMELEQHPCHWNRIQDVRRSAHTLKGAAGSVGLHVVSKLAHRMEDMLNVLFQSQQPIASESLSLLYETADAVQDLIHGGYSPDTMQTTVTRLFQRYDAALPGPDVPAPAEESLTDLNESTEPLAESHADFVNNGGTSLDEAGLAVDCSMPLDDVPSAVEGSVGQPSGDPPAMRQAALGLGDLTHPTNPAHEQGGQQSVHGGNSTEDMPATPEAQTEDAPTETDRATDHAELDPARLSEFLPQLGVWTRLPEPITHVPPPDAASEAELDEEKRQRESLRVPLQRIDALMREVGELIVNRSTLEQRLSSVTQCANELRRAVDRLRHLSRELDARYGVGALGGHRPLWGDGATLVPSGRRLVAAHEDEFDPLEFDRYGEFHLLSRSLAETTTDLGTVSGELQTLISDCHQLLNRQGQHARETQDQLMRIRLVPLSSLTAQLQRTVRTVASQRGKLVALQIAGGDLEIDKQVLSELSDPLLHLLRNAVDHGIETPDVRLAAGKPEQATIRVTATNDGTQVLLQISDDGAGLNYAAIRAAVIRNGLLAEQEANRLSQDELAAFIFLPGFSTASEVTEVSGRGVGMDIVRDRVQKLKGTILVESVAGQGTTFTLRVPMMLGVVRALLVQAASKLFALPVQAVVQIVRADRDQIEREGDTNTIRLSEETLRLVFLHEWLHLNATHSSTSATVPVLVVSAGDRKLALAVDKVFPGREVVVKSLGTHLRRVKGLIGATLLGDGSVVPILDTAELVGARTSVARPRFLRPVLQREPQSACIMVVDDSVSVRRVMANQLKGAGFNVLEAKDGLDALDQLHRAQQSPDLFLLDIEMPRMDGYELLASLRAQAKHRASPVVMVTSRAGAKHRKKAMKLGATDYLVKPYQADQLLLLIRSLLAAAAEPALSSSPG